MSILRLQARGESQPTPEGPRLSMHCKTSRGEVCGESGTNCQYQTPVRPLGGLCSWRSHSSCERRCARDQMSIVRSRTLVEPPSQPLFALVTQWEERENVAWRDQKMVAKETTLSVAPMLFIFAYNYSDKSNNRPQKTYAWVYFGWIERFSGFFLPSIERHFCWNLLKSNNFFLVLKCKRQLLSGPS